MPTVANSLQTYLDALDQMIPEVGQRFIKAEHRIIALNRAAIKVAGKLGGLKFFYTTPITVDVKDQVLADHITNVGTTIYMVTNIDPIALTEDRDFYNVVDKHEFHALRAKDSTLKLAYYQRENGNILHIDPVIAVAGNIEMVAYGLPEDYSVDTLSTDISQLNAIVEEAASILRIRSRDFQEVGLLHQLAKESVEDAAMMESRKNETDRIQMAQNSPRSRLRSRG